MRGRFVSLEGGEGAGKSTLLEGLAARLRDEGHEVVTSREPGGTPEGEQLRPLILSGNWPVETALDLLHAARAHHCWSVINPALERGAWVLVDRFVDSTFAYQANERPGWAREILEMSRIATGNLFPDLTFWLDVEPAVGLERVSEDTHFERREFAYHERVRRTFRLIAKADPKRVVRLDATALDAAALLAAAWETVTERLPAPR